MDGTVSARWAPRRNLFLASVLVSSSLLGCATSDTSDELPETLVDGAADSWASPTNFGFLFDRVWQRGELDPGRRIKYPAWEFSLGADARVAITTHQAPTDEPDLTRAYAYLYKRNEDDTSWKRIAKAEPGTGFAAITKDLGEGRYRVLVKGATATDEGEFMLRMECSGAGCPSGPQCLAGDGEFWQISDLHNGALTSYGDKELSATSEIRESLKAQIIAAVNESAHSVTTIAEAFDAVDGGVVNKYIFWDNLVGRNLTAIEYGAGDNSYGAIFVEDSATVAAGIHDGFIENCTIEPKTCVFGESMYEAAFMPGMHMTEDVEYTSPAGIDAMTAKQIIKALTYDEPLTLAETFENVDDGVINVRRYTHDDGRKFVEVQWHGGDNPVGAYFRDGSEEKVAENGDGEIAGCTETY